MACPDLTDSIFPIILTPEGGFPMSKKPKSRKSYPAEFREKAVKLVTECGYAVEQVAAKLGCAKESVRRWKEAATQKT